jgi:hypothetical protein
MSDIIEKHGNAQAGIHPTNIKDYGINEFIQLELNTLHLYQLLLTHENNALGNCW